MPKINLSDVERLMVAAILTLGKSAIDKAYNVINPNSAAEEGNRHRMALRWFRSDNVKAYYHELLTISRETMTLIDKEDVDDEPLTKGMLIREMRKALKMVSDPESRSKLVMRLADLANLKKEDEERQREMRTYFVPYVSDCNSCALMKEFKKLQQCCDDKS